MINTNNTNQVRKEIQKLKKENKKIVIEAQDDEFNRKIFEMNNVDMVVGLEFDRRDKLKQRDSGMNEVIAKLAAKNNIAIGIDIHRIRRLNLLEKGKVLSRVKQNIQLCKRTGAKIMVLGADRNEAREFVVSLGGSTSQGKNAFLVDYNKI